MGENKVFGAQRTGVTLSHMATDTSQADYAIAQTLAKFCDSENRAFVDCKELNEFLTSEGQNTIRFAKPFPAIMHMKGQLKCEGNID